VFWGFDSLPFQDLPAHAGLISLRHRFPVSPFDQRFFVYAPHLGFYSLFRFLGDVLMAPLGAIGAVRALATLPFVAMPVALCWARRRLHHDESRSAGYFGIALGFGFMTLLGFASYLIGIVLLLVALTGWLELMARSNRDDESTARREAAAAILSPLLLLAHGFAFAVFLSLAVTTAAATGARRRRLKRLRALLPGALLAVWIGWRERAWALPPGAAASTQTSLSGHIPGHFPVHFQGVLDKLGLLVTPTLLTRTGLDVFVGLVIWIVVGAAVVASARWAMRPGPPAAPPSETSGSETSSSETSRAHVKAIVVAIAVLAGAFLLLPHAVGWFGFIDGRLVPLMILLGLLAVHPPALGARLHAAFERTAPATASAMVAIALLASRSFQREAQGWREVLAAVPAGARLLNLPLDPNSDVFTAHPFVHYDKLAAVDRPVLVSDVWFHQGSALYPTPENPSLRLPPTYVESDLRTVDWPSYRLTDWDYVLIRVRPGAREPGVMPPLKLVAHAGGWWLFGVDLFRFAPTQS
jgi:hypothetical protein